MSITVRLSDVRELANRLELIAQSGTATVLSGTGAFVAPIAMLREIAGAP